MRLSKIETVDDHIIDKPLQNIGDWLELPVRGCKVASKHSMTIGCAPATITALTMSRPSAPLPNKKH